MRWLAILLLGGLIGSCFNPDYPEGVQCSPEDGSCPPDMVCDPRDNICRVEALPGTCGDGIIQEVAGEVCDFGSDLCCNETCDGPVAAGTECRAKAGECDVAEQCDGTATSCPDDGSVSDGDACTTCPAGNQLCECIGGACVDLCGNGVIDGAEACDGDAVSQCPGFCNADCTCAFGASCQAYNDAVPGLPDGTYTILPPGAEGPTAVQCDMTTDGGGWTAIDPATAVAFGGVATAVVSVGQTTCVVNGQGLLEAFYDTPGIDDEDELVCQYDIPLGFAFDTLRVSQAAGDLLRFLPIVGPGDTVDITDRIADPWGTAAGPGDLTLGTPASIGPALSLGRAIGNQSLGDGEPAEWLKDETEVTTEDTTLRMQFTETGVEEEGLRWESGRIYVRKSAALPAGRALHCAPGAESSRAP